MPFIGNPIDTRNTFQALVGKRFDGDGSTTAFTLDVAPSSTLDLEVFVGNVRQDPNSAYSVSGTTLTFTGAPPSGTNNIYVVHQAKSVGTIDVPASFTSDAQTFSGGLTSSGTTTVSGALTASGGATISGTTPTLTIGDAGAEDTKIVFDGNAQDYHIGLDDSSDDLVIGLGSTLGTTSYLNIDEGGKLSTGGETAPDIANGGLCINGGANDESYLTFKSSDIAHGMTSEDETDTFATIAKQSATTGGLQIRSFAESKTEEWLELNCQADSDIQETKSASAKGAFTLVASKKSGTGTNAINANGNLLTIAGYTSTEFIFEGNGNFHAESGSTTFDAYEDAQLARAFDLSHGRGVIESKFDKFVQYNHEKLAELKLVGRDEDGTPNSMLNVTGLQRLHNGAIWQQYEKHNQLLEAVYDLAKEAVGEEKANAILEKHEVKRLQ
jgi:hypothetical protein